MNTSRLTEDIPPIVVWYFVGATFAFAASVLFSGDVAPWVRIVLLAAGMVAIFAGGIHIGVATTRKRRAGDEEPAPEV